MNATVYFAAAGGLILIAMAHVLIQRGYLVSIVFMVVGIGMGLAGFNQRLGGSIHPCTAILEHLHYGVDPGFGLIQCQRMVLDRSLGWSIFRSASS